ncbi:MAG: DNA ligase, partial [Nanoarchaeota archaeon]
MLYSEIVAVYGKLAGTTKRLEKTSIIAGFLPLLRGNEEYAYLLRGRVFAEYDSREFGISNQLVIKAISRASGFSSDEVVLRFKKTGDLGDVAVELLEHKRQNSLFSKKLTVGHVFSSLQKIASI